MRLPVSPLGRCEPRIVAWGTSHCKTSRTGNGGFCEVCFEVSLDHQFGVRSFFQSGSVFFVETGLAAFGLERLALDQDPLDLCRLL